MIHQQWFKAFNFSCKTHPPNIYYDHILLRIYPKLNAYRRKSVFRKEPEVNLRFCPLRLVQGNSALCRMWVSNSQPFGTLTDRNTPPPSNTSRVNDYLLLCTNFIKDLQKLYSSWRRKFSRQRRKLLTSSRIRIQNYF